MVRINAADQKMALSIRAIEEREGREAIRRAADQARTQTATLGDLLSQELLDKVAQRGDVEEPGGESQSEE